MTNSYKIYCQINELYRSMQDFNNKLDAIGFTINPDEKSPSGKFFNDGYQIIPSIILDLIKAKSKTIYVESAYIPHLETVFYAEDSNFYIDYDDFYDIFYNHNTNEMISLFWNGFVNNNNDCQLQLNKLVGKQIFKY